MPKRAAGRLPGRLTGPLLGEKSLWEQALGGNGNRARTIVKTIGIDVKHGAGGETRTLDEQLGRLTL